MDTFSVVGHPSCMSVHRCPRGTQGFKYINQSLAGLVLQMLIHCTNTVYRLICVSSMEFLSLLKSPSVQFSHSAVSNSLWPRGLQHARLPCPSPTPGTCSNSCPLSQWCHPTISSSVSLFSSGLQSFPASGSFPMSQFFTSGRAKVLEFQLQYQSFHWIFRTDSLYDWLVWSPCSPRDSQESSPTPQFKSINSSTLSLSLLYGPTHICTWLLEAS